MHFISTINSACWVIFHDFVLSTIFKINCFPKKILSGTLSECQTVWIQFRPKVLSGLTWVLTVYKGYQRMKKVAASKYRVKTWPGTNMQ